MGCCFSSPSHHEPQRRDLGGDTSDDAHTTFARPSTRPSPPRPLAQLPQTRQAPHPTPRTLRKAPAKQSHQKAALREVSRVSSAPSAAPTGPSRPQARDPGLRFTTDVSYSARQSEPGNISPVSAESVSTRGQGKVRRRVTTSVIRRKYHLPPRKRDSVAAEDAIRE